MTLTRPDTHADLIEELDELVRERVLSEGVDPQRDTSIVRRIAEDVVRRHDERSLTGAVVPVADPGAVIGELIARVSGFGPLQPFLDDPRGRGDLGSTTRAALMGDGGCSDSGAAQLRR